MRLEQTTGRNLGWEQIEAAILNVAKISEEAIERLVLVGGSASAFYQDLLERAKDPDFKPPVFTLEEKILWLSKDVDFMGMSKEELSELLGIAQTGTPPNVYVHGIWIDIVDNGLTLSGDSAVNAGAEFDLKGVAINVLTPAMLYKEKRALTKLPNPRPQDFLHLKTLKEFVPYYLTATLEKGFVPSRQWVKLASQAKNIEPSLLKHPALVKRLKVVQLGAEYRSSAAWIKHHIEPIATTQCLS